MKILFVLGRPNPFPSASWTRIGFFANSWADKGHFIDVLGTFSYTSLQKRGVGKLGKVSIFNLVFNIGKNHPLIFMINKAISFLVSGLFVVTRKPHIVVISFPTGDVGLGALLACRLLRKRVVIDYRDEWEDFIINNSKSRINREAYKLLKVLMSKIYMKSKLVVAVTSCFARGLSLRGVKYAKVVTNGADVNVFKPKNKINLRRELSLPLDHFVMVYSGTINISGYYKLDVVIRTLANLNNKLYNKVKLIIVGQGPDLPKILTMAKDLGLYKKILYFGAKTDKKELAEILAASDVGIIPGLYSKGQLPAKFFEYCACGLPIIGTIPNESILAKLIIAHELGITAPLDDEEKIAEAIYWIYKNKVYRKIAGKNARSLVKKNYDRKKISNDFLSLVEQVVK